LFVYRFSVNIFPISDSSHSCYMIRQFNFPLFDQPVIFGEEYILWSSSLRNFLHPSVTSSIFDPNIPVRALFLNNSEQFFYEQIPRTFG
jgi:hypothetical protein